MRRRATSEEWAYIFARVRLHIALNHLDPGKNDIAWHFAAWCCAEEIISVAGVGCRPADLPLLPTGLPRGNEERLRQYFQEERVAPEIAHLSLGLPGQAFWSFKESFTLPEPLRTQRLENFATGLRQAASEAVEIAGGVQSSMGSRKVKTLIVKARDWFISEYPLLASLAASFIIIEDEEICQSQGVDLAAICDNAGEIYVNPLKPLSFSEAQFVIGHELLHAGLRHTLRRQGRDPWFWNVACDYIINDWLIEMGVGNPPEGYGYLHDRELRGFSAEAVYDRIVCDLRKGTSSPIGNTRDSSSSLENP